MAALLTKIRETVAYIQSVYSETPAAGVVLGSGLGNFTAELEIEKEINYQDIPHFPVSTVEGHTGRLVFGKLGDKRVVVMAGRFHFYEGYLWYTELHCQHLQVRGCICGIQYHNKSCILPRPHRYLDPRQE